MVNRRAILVRVRHVRTQNKYGVIFHGERITDGGEIIDTHSTLTVRIYGKGLSGAVMPGQWWSVVGRVKSRTFVNRGGFEMTEDQIDVERDRASLHMPSGAHIVAYLASNPRFEGIGKVTAERLWEVFGDSLFAILDDGDTPALADVIGPQRAAMLTQGWREEGLSNTLQWLQSQGIGIAIGRRIVNYFGATAIDKIAENPYRLLSFAADWSEVDNLALYRLGIEPDDDRRLAAALEETVYRRFSRGDTFVPRAELVIGLRSILIGDKILRDMAEKVVVQSEVSGRLQFDREGNAYSLGASILENNVVECITARLGRGSRPCDVEAIIKAYESREGHGFALNKEQREAVYLIAENDFAVVTGGAGVGKTTVLKCIYDVLDYQGYDIVQLAIAGKAARRIMDATNRPASTLASFIKRMKGAGEVVTNAGGRPMAIVIDEASMIDLISFNGATRLIEDNTKIILVGDPHQLPPVGPGLILHCLTDRPEIPHVELKTARRFNSTIAGIANAVKAGTFPPKDHFADEIRLIEAPDSELARLGAEIYLADPEDTVVLCATRKISETVNQLIQESLAPGCKPLKQWNVEYDTWEYTGFYQGDLLICTRNHWDLGIQNGSLGRLVEVTPPLAPELADESSEVLGWIEWDDGETRPLHENLLDDLALGYALTVHKSQGSQWRRVVICLPTVSRIVDRSLIYTAITRAQSEIVILGNHKHLVQSVAQQKSADRRKVGLPRRLNAALGGRDALNS